MSVESLWAGPDHLLAIDSRGFSEDYKRFYYKDIQAFITRKTLQGKIQNILFGIFCGLFILFAILTGNGWAIFWEILTGLFLLLLLANWLLGPTCVCHIQTAVQSEKLPSLSRLNTAKKTISRIKPMIHEAQGVLTEEMIRENPLNEPSSLTSKKKIDKHSRHESGHYHTILFSLLISDGLLGTFDLFYNHLGITLLTTAISMSIAVFVIIALVKQHDSDLTGGLRSLTWGSLVYVVINFGLGTVLMMVVAIQNPQTFNNQWAILLKFSELNPLDRPWIMAIFIFTIVCSSLLGFFGLGMLAQFRKAYQVALTAHQATHSTATNP